MALLREIVSKAESGATNAGPDFRRRIEFFMLLRLVVFSLLLGATIYFQIKGISRLETDSAVLPLYILIAATFVLSIIYALYLIIIPGLRFLSYFQIGVDILYATVLVHFTGGAGSPFTLLYFFPVIASGILHERRGALLTSSMASICFGLLINLRFHQVLPPTNWPWLTPWMKDEPSYVLWVLVVHVTCFFLVGVIASSAEAQLRKTRASLSRKERDFQSLSELHSSIVESIPIGILTAHEGERVTFANQAASVLLRMSPKQLIGTPLQSIFPGIDNNSMKGNMQSPAFLTTRELDGEIQHLELRVSNLQETGSVREGRVVIFQDVTRLRQMEERIKSSEQQAAFVRIAAGLAHEIRNPLASLRAATELLCQSYTTDGDRRLFEIVLRESDRLNTLLTDFLSLVGRSKPKNVRVRLSDVVEDILSLFSRDPRVSGRIVIETFVSKGVEVEGEPSRLRQAIWNILANAVDAIEEGGKIRVVLEEDLEDQQAVFYVRDTGKGIPPEIRHRLFEPFITTKEKGTGLGLALVLSVVEQHQGTIDIESFPGEGTTVTIRFPLAMIDFSKAIQEVPRA